MWGEVDRTSVLTKLTSSARRRRDTLRGERERANLAQVRQLASRLVAMPDQERTAPAALAEERRGDEAASALTAHLDSKAGAIVGLAATLIGIAVAVAGLAAASVLDGVVGRTELVLGWCGSMLILGVAGGLGLHARRVRWDFGDLSADDQYHPDALSSFVSHQISLTLAVHLSHLTSRDGNQDKARLVRRAQDWLMLGFLGCVGVAIAAVLVVSLGGQ